MANVNINHETGLSSDIIESDDQFATDDFLESLNHHGRTTERKYKTKSEQNERRHRLMYEAEVRQIQNDIN